MIQKTISVVNEGPTPDGKRGNWALKVDGEVLASDIRGWTNAVDKAKVIAAEMASPVVAVEILLFKMNGTVKTISGSPSKARGTSNATKATPTVLEVEGERVYIARIQKGLDADVKESSEHDTLAAAIKALPRKAQQLDWSLVDVSGFEQYDLDDGRIASIERTTN